MDIQTVTTTVSAANQTAVPSVVRKILNLAPGDQLIWQVNKRKAVAKIKARPQKLGDYLSGLGKEVWEDVDTDEYIKEGRKDRTY